MTFEKKYEVIYGEHACVSVLANESRKIFEILVLDKAKIDEKYTRKYKDIIKVVDKKYLEKATRTEDKHQGIALKVGQLIEKQDLYSLISKLPEQEFCYGFILDRVQDPQNIGSIIRSSYCFGASFLMVSKNEAPVINATIIRSSVGYSECLPIYTVSNIAREIESLKKSGFWIVGLDSNLESDLPKNIISQYNNRIIFVLGSEGYGMRDLTKKSCDSFIKIPMIAGAESLNVANAATIISYESYLKKIK